MLEGRLKSALEIKQGDTFHLEIQWTDSEGTPVDMSGCSARMQLRRTPSEGVLLDMSTENGRITLGFGSIVLDVDAVTMRELSTPEGSFDLQITYSDGRVTTILGGAFRLIPDVTYDSNS